MAAKEFVLIPKDVYISKQPEVEQILQQPSIKEKAMQLSLLQRNNFQDSDKEEIVENVPPENIWKEKVLTELQMLPKPQIERSKIIYDKIITSDRIKIDENGYLVFNNTPTNIRLTTFLYKLQQSRASLENIYRDLLLALNIGSHLTANTNAKFLIENPTLTISDKEVGETDTEYESRKEKLWDTFPKGMANVTKPIYKRTGGVRKREKSSKEQ